MGSLWGSMGGYEVIMGLYEGLLGSPWGAMGMGGGGGHRVTWDPIGAKEWVLSDAFTTMKVPPTPC